MCQNNRMDMPILPERSARDDVSRRDFLAKGLLTAGALSLSVGNSTAAEPKAARRFPVIAFSKPFQKFGPEQTAELVTTVGLDGIEIPVRPKGQIEPERAPD